MTRTTPTDLAAMEAEIAALEAASTAQDARVEALLASWQPMPTTAQLVAGLRADITAHGRALDAIEAEQAEISAAIDHLGL